MKVCWVALIGRPNVGKSTLLNNLIKYDLSIVSPISQTTRDKISGIITEGEYQFIFIDTPGIHKPLSALGQSLNKKSFETINESDLVLFLTPSNQEISTGDNLILNEIKNVKNKIAIITKSDLANILDINKKKKELVEHGFNEILSTSTNDVDSFENVIESIKKYAYEDQKYYDENYITDRSELFISKEIIRNSAISFLDDELPHSIAVEITKYDINEKNNKRTIEAIIYCKKESQKGIVVGKNGAMIKKIGSKARREIMNKFNTNATLNLYVKVDKNWTDNEKSIKQFGY